MMRMCWYILGTCQLVKVFWYFRSNTFDACCQKKKLIVAKLLSLCFWLSKKSEEVSDCWICWWTAMIVEIAVKCCQTSLIVVTIFWLLPKILDRCQNCLIVTQDYLIVVWIFWLLTCCQNFLIVVRIFWLLKLLMDDYDCWSCCQVLQNFAACCQDFLVIVRISWLFPGLSDCCQNFLFVVGIFRLLSGSSDCCQDFLIVVRGFCDCCQISRVVIKTF